MQNLLTIIFSLYPSALIYGLIPDTYLSKLDNLAPSGFLFFISHLLVFGIIFFIVFTVLKKFVGVGYMSSGKRGFLGISILAILMAFVILIIFYTVLPGATVYASPTLVDKYLLTQPFTLIALLLPFGYLFFD